MGVASSYSSAPDTLYLYFNQLSCPDKQAFRDKLLDPDHGLPVHVITETHDFVQGLCCSEEW